MARCEDFPCCGHLDADGTAWCPDENGQFGCCLCGNTLPRTARSSICGECQSRPGAMYEPGSPEWYDAMDRDYDPWGDDEDVDQDAWDELAGRVPGQSVWFGESEAYEIVRNDGQAGMVWVLRDGQELGYDYRDVAELHYDNIPVFQDSGRERFGTE